MSQYFPKLCKSFNRNIKVELDLSNYATRVDLKRTKDADTLNSAANSDLASLKTEVDKIDIGKLKTVPADLTKLSNVIDNDVVKKKTVDNKLVTKVNFIKVSSTSRLAF